MTETFGKRFSELRKKHHFTQEDIAKKLNITPQAISKWENDLSAPDIMLLKEIANIFNISIDGLLGNETTTTLIQNEKRDINKMLFKISILSSKGDKININLPLAIIKLCVESNLKLFTIEATFIVVASIFFFDSMFFPFIPLLICCLCGSALCRIDNVSGRRDSYPQTSRYAATFP